MSMRRWIIVAAVLVAAVAGYFLWRYLSPRESTDDAQVAGHVTPVAARASGPVKAIHVMENQTVKTGDVLVEIDPRDYEIALAHAQADLAAAEAGARAARTSVPLTSTTAKSEQHVAETGTANAEAALHAADREVEASRAKLSSAQAHLVEVTANSTRASQDLERLRPLVAKDEIPKQQFDTANAAAEAAKATVDSASAAIREAQANLDVALSKRDQATGVLAQAKDQATAASTAPQQIAQTEAQAGVADARVLQARAALDQAQVNLDRTKVRAATNGIVSRRTVEQGQIVQVGQPLMSVTTLDDVWVVANFKETQLESIRQGMRASISVDAYGHSYTAHVDSISAATGATFSLLPPDNATGNFVKVVQRVPVKIFFDSPSEAGQVLRPGMSVDATVYMH
jgi:membrane fusion protein (multidrug efflux system)